MPTSRQIDQAVAQVCADVIQEPLLYFSEADIQQLLAAKLTRVPGLKRTAQTKVRKGTGSKSMYATSLVHCEYGAGEGRRADIVVFKRSDVENISTTNLERADEGYIKPQYAFEIGTEKTSDADAHIKGDLKKLSKIAKDRGYIIHIYRDTTCTARGKRRANTDAKIKRAFRMPIETRWAMKKDNVRIVAILIRVGRDQPKMRGKCEIYLGGGNLHKANVSKKRELEETILSVLT